MSILHGSRRRGPVQFWQGGPGAFIRVEQPPGSALAAHNGPMGTNNGASLSATVAWLCTAPVKALRVQETSVLHLDRHGARGDRRFAITDPEGHLFNGKRLGALVQVVAMVADPDGALSLRFPGGDVVSEVPRLGGAGTMLAYGEERAVRTVIGPWSEALSRWAGRELRLVQPVDPGNGVDRGGDGGGVTLLSVASLEALARAAGVETVDRRRFRMTVGVDGIAAYEEEEWLGRTVRVGTATVRFHGNVGRCAVTTQDPDRGVADLPTLHVLRRIREGTPTTEPLPFGIWGEVVEPGEVRVGDEVRPG
jgi:uncharacterized protein YcbX